MHIALIGIDKTTSLIFEDGAQIISPSHLAIVYAWAPHEQANWTKVEPLPLQTKLKTCKSRIRASRMQNLGILY